MTEHLTTRQASAWRDRSAEAEELLLLDDHLAGCAECRALVAQGLESSVLQVRKQFSSDHLTDAQLDDFALRRPLPADVMRHIDECDDCRLDADDLRRHADSAPEVRTGKPEGKARPAIPSWLRSVAAAIAITALGLSVWLALNRRKTGEPEARPAASDPRDEFASNIPAPYREEVLAAMKSGKLDIPASIAATAAGPIQLRSAEVARPSFHVVSPLATAVVEDTPLFRWTPVAGATFTVSVYDDQFRLVTKSRALKETAWRPDRSLARGAVYRWEVKMVSGEHTESAPGTTEPEATFSVLGDADARRLADARAAMSNEPLAMGILYANAGALDDARRELSAAALGSDPARKSLSERLRGQLK